MITKGHPLKYVLAMYLQKLLWKVVSDCPIFQYTGHPVDEADFQEIFRGVSEDEIYVSGDYKASTDNLNPELSDYVWECISETVTFQGKPLAETIFGPIGRQCLTGHTLLYGKKGDYRSKIRNGAN